MEKEFDVNGWDYTNACAEVHKIRDGYRWLDKIEERGRSFSADPVYTRLKEAANSTVGKAFGLALAELIFCRIKGHSKFVVPAWFEVRQPMAADHSFWSSCADEFSIVRSSYQEEDWMDPRSGVGTSVVCYNQQMALNLINDRVASGEVCIVQKFEGGCGCVVDVGYSELLERPIVRVARGNRSTHGSGYRYTSATWDHEARVAIYDANSACKLYGSDLGFHSGHDPFPELVKELVSKLREAGWITKFGFQFEIVVDPIPGARLRMVQMRPSPGAIQGMGSRPEVKGKLISTTGKVNRAGTAVGDLVADQPYSEESLCRKAQALSDGWKNEKFDLTGKVVLWDYASLKYNSAQTIYGAGLAGAVAQITGHSLFTNSGHGTYMPYSSQGLELGAWEKSRNVGLQFGGIGDHGMTHQLERSIRKSGMKLHLVSDGLVGQIYQLE